MNIAVVVPGGMAETLRASPLIGALAGIGGEPLLVVCAPTAAALARRVHGADEVLAVPGLGAPPSPAGLARLWAHLRSRRLDVVIVCSESAAVRAAAYLAAVPRRVGCAVGLSDRLLTDRVACATDGNHARSWLGLGAALGVSEPAPGPTVAPGELAAAAAEELLLSRGIGDGRLLVAIAPGTGFAEHEVAQWGPERFAHLGNRLSARHGAGIVLVGDERDRRVADAMLLDLAADSVDLCGEIDVVTTAAVLARCDLLVATDTPALHLAAAVGTTSVGIFGSTDGRVGAPSGGEHRVVQALAGDRTEPSLDRVRVDDVLAGIESAL